MCYGPVSSLYVYLSVTSGRSIKTAEWIALLGGIRTKDTHSLSYIVWWTDVQTSSWTQTGIKLQQIIALELFQKRDARIV